MRLLQEHYGRAVQLGQAVGQLDETIRPDLLERKKEINKTKGDFSKFPLERHIRRLECNKTINNWYILNTNFESNIRVRYVCHFVDHYNMNAKICMFVYIHRICFVCALKFRKFMKFWHSNLFIEMLATRAKNNNNNKTHARRHSFPLSRACVRF